MQFRRRYILYLLLLIILVWLIYRFYFILAWVLIAAVVSLLGRPLMNLLGKIHIGRFAIPRFVRAIFTLIAFYGSLVLLLSLFIPLLIEQAGLLADIDPSRITSAFSQPLSDFQVWLASLGVEDMDLHDTFNQMIQDGFRDLFNLGSLPDLFTNTIGFVMNTVVSLFAITFMSFFFLKDDQLFYRMVMAATPDEYMPQMKNVLRNTKVLLTRYFVGIIIQLGLFTAVVTFGLTLVGNKYAFIIGFTAGVLNIIPYIGPFIGAAFGILIAITTNLQLDFYTEMPWLILKTYLVFFTAQVLDNYIFGPTIFGKVVKAHPIEIFTVVIIAGYLAGIPAMIVAIPTYTLLRIVAKEFLSEFKIVQKLTQNI